MENSGLRIVRAIGRFSPGIYLLISDVNSGKGKHGQNHKISLRAVERKMLQISPKGRKSNEWIRNIT